MPTDINIAGSGTNEVTTVTLTVTGAGSSATTALPLDVVFAIDSSGSMALNDPSNLRLSAAKSFLDKMNSSSDTAGIISWDDSIDFSEPLSSDFVTLKSKIDTIDASGGTDLNVGLNGAINVLDANTRKGDSAKVIVFLTDGQGTYNNSTAMIAASKGYKIYSIGLSNSSDPAPLKDMANITGGKYFDSPSAANLQAIYNEIFNQVVISTIPNYVDVVEATQDYIVDEGSFNIAPDSVVTDGSGITTITWKNIGNGDGSPDLKANENVVLSFKAKSNKAGSNMGVDVLGTSKVNYKDSNGIYAGSVNIPQAYINVNGGVQNNPPVPEAGPDQVVKQNIKNGAKVTLDGSGSTDDGKISPLTYTWTWKGGSAKGVRPTITLPVGITTVTLKVFDGQYSSTDTVSITVPCQCKPVAAFSASPTSGKAPLMVKFTDKSTGSPASWSWNFGDKTTSTAQNPTHKYVKPGKYTVSLTVKNAIGSSTKKMTNYIIVK